jgi:anti-sigma regulatory factor (Ser/Thr protein kinase)
MPTISLLLKNDMPEIERLAEEVTRFANQHGVPPETAGDLNLALEEVVANVIMHAYPQGGAHEIRVDVTAEKDRVTAEVVDDGVRFDPLQGPEPNVALPLAQRPVGGLGLFLVRRVMDELHYSREAGRNRLTMVKKVGSL